MKGVNLDEVGKEENEERLRIIKIRAEAKALGQNPEIAEFHDAGVEFEVED